MWCLAEQQSTVQDTVTFLSRHADLRRTLFPCLVL
jgi:hypothetical protein